MIYRNILAAALCALIPPAAAAEKTLGVRTLMLESGELPETYLKGAKGHLPVRFSNIQPSKPLRVLYKNPLPIFRTGTDPEGNEVFTEVGSAKLPPNARGILLLCWQSGDTTRFKAIRDDFDSARSGEWMLINATTKPIAFRIGKDTKAIRVAPGSSETHRISAKANKGAAVTAATPAGKEWKMFFSTYWPVYADKRCLVLFVADGEKIRVKRITDRIVKAKK